MNHLKKLNQHYLKFSIILTNSFLLFLGINLVLGLGYWGWDSWKATLNPPIHIPDRLGLVTQQNERSFYQRRWVDLRSYGEIPQNEIDQVLTDFYYYGNIGYRFRPYYHFSTAPFKSSTLNVLQTEDGFSYRSNGKEETRSVARLNDGVEDIYIFGGSTTFGWNVADHWTIPAYLESLANQQNRNVRVWNFGMPYFSWNQEFVFLTQILKNGHAPDLVIFIDGINYARITPEFSDEIQDWWDRRQFDPNANDLPSAIPLFRLVNYFQRKPKRTAFENYLKQRYPIKTEENFKNNYLQTYWMTQALAEKYHFKLLFVWQPHKSYQCNDTLYTPALPEDSQQATRKLYQSMESLRDEQFLTLSHLCNKNGLEKRVFIDDVHYSPQFNAFIAEEIVHRLP